MPMTDASRKHEQTIYGPHAGRWVGLYANALALGALKANDSTGFPPGAVIAKEKLRRPTEELPEGVAFMIKHGKGEFAESGGWEFAYYPSSSGASYRQCVSCHRAGGVKDYVFATLTPATSPRAY